MAFRSNDHLPLGLYPYLEAFDPCNHCRRLLQIKSRVFCDPCPAAKKEFFPETHPHDPDLDEVGGYRYHLPPLCVLLTTWEFSPISLGGKGGSIVLVESSVVVYILLPASWGRAAEGAGRC